MTPDDDLPCNELVELVTDHLEGALPEATRARFEAHLSICDGCTRYVDQIRTTVELLGGLPAPELSEGARERLLEAYRTSRTAPRHDPAT